MSTRRRRPVPGVTVYQRNRTWSYRVDVDPDVLTGKRQRENRGGFATEQEAWTEAVKAKAALEAGRYVKASGRTVRQFAGEWLASVEHSLKPSTYANYVDYLDAYVFPRIGDRRLQDINVTVLNALLRHLLDRGRCKPNTNAVMFEYWSTMQKKGTDLTPRELSIACSTSIHAARSAIRRYKAGRTPRVHSPGLAPKTVRNIANMLHEAFEAAVVWHYLEHNPTDHLTRPRVKRRQMKTWTAPELAAFLTEANRDRFRAMWMLVATTGMRRSELAGAERDLLDLANATLVIAPTRVVVDGKPVDEDGKTASGVRTIALDPGTIAVLQQHLAMLDVEREAWGPSYPDHGKLFCYEGGRRVHPDTITRRFNRIVDRAGLPKITLHGVRHSYATVCIDNGINPKILSERIGHGSVAFTLHTYVQRSPDRDRDRAAAAAIADLITGGATPDTPT